MSRKSNLITEKPLHEFIPIDYKFNQVHNLSRVSLTNKMMVNVSLPVDRNNNQYLKWIRNDGLSNNPYNRSHNAYDTPIYKPGDDNIKIRYSSINYR